MQNYYYSKYLKFTRRMFLKDSKFCIISDNCWGGFIYQHYGLVYNTPFIGLFIFSPDYIRLLKNLTNYLKLELKFIDFDKSKYYNYIKEYIKYPVALLADIEIHFMHYQNELEASKKWNYRVMRLNYNNLIIKFCERDLCNAELVDEFSKLDYQRKVCFTSKDYPHSECIKLKNEYGLEIKNEWENFLVTVPLNKFLNSFY